MDIIILTACLSGKQTTSPPNVSIQRFMNDVLKSIIKKFALVYLDDVIMYSKTLEQHIVHIEKVLDLLRKAGL